MGETISPQTAVPVWRANRLAIWLGAAAVLAGGCTKNFPLRLLNDRDGGGDVDAAVDPDGGDGQVVTCGDGLIGGGESCDDGNTTDGDGCSFSCQTEPGWVCSGEPSVCFETCGNGQLDTGETCDDGNTTADDGCSFSCQTEPGWVCTGEPSVCSETCGNGQLDTGETCDDGNLSPNDGCSNICMIEVGWDCTGEPSSCSPICTDGFIVGLETCDDENTNNGDGCSDTCQLESGWVCSGTPSVCQPDCGDGQIVGGEECDGANLDGQSCTTLSLGVGQLTCSGGCVFDTSDCVVWIGTDVGNPLAGNWSWSAGTFTVEGNGDNIWDDQDNFYFVYREQMVSGDFDFQARVVSVENTDPWAKAGLMARESLTSTSPNTFSLIARQGTHAFQRRTATGGITATDNTAGIGAPRYIRLTRSGNTFRAYWSDDGTNWTETGSGATVALPASVYLGLAVTSHDSGTLCTAVFDSVQLQ